jgi:chromosome segregation ATPase
VDKAKLRSELLELKLKEAEIDYALAQEGLDLTNALAACDHQIGESIQDALGRQGLACAFQAQEACVANQALNQEFQGLLNRHQQLACQLQQVLTVKDQDDQQMCVMQKNEAALRVSIDESDWRQNQLEHQLQAVTAAKAQDNHLLRELQTETEALRASKEEADRMVAHLTQVHSQMDSEMKRVSVTLEEDCQKVGALKMSNAELRESLHRAETDNRKRSQEITRLTQEMARFKQGPSGVADALKKENAILREELQKFQKENLQKTQMLAQYGKRLTEYAQQIQILQSKHQQTLDEEKAMMAYIKEADQDRASMRQSLQQTANKPYPANFPVNFIVG